MISFYVISSHVNPIKTCIIIQWVILMHYQPIQKFSVYFFGMKNLLSFLSRMHFISTSLDYLKLKYFIFT